MQQGPIIIGIRNSISLKKTVILSKFKEKLREMLMDNSSSRKQKL